MMLADYLRQEQGLTGTKIVCAEGDCGACTVLRRFDSPKKGSKKSAAEFLPINSCITRVAQMDGSSLVTVEGVTPEEGLSPVQKAMVHCHGSQCGFCTPGFVMALTGPVEKKIACKSKTIECQETKNALTGNLCRCTGYQPILDAAQAIPLKECESVQARHVDSEQVKTLRKIVKTPVELELDGFRFFAPTTLSAAVKYLRKNPQTRLLAGGTDLGVLRNKRKLLEERFLSLHLIPELYEIKKVKTTRAVVGARVTLSELREFSKELLPELARFLDLFASPQIKNVATLAGNVGNASPIAETPPFLLVAQTVVTVAGPKGRRKIPIDEFFLGYRQTALKKGEFIVSFEFDLPKKSERLSLYKVSQRKDLDISAVNAAFRVEWAKSAQSPRKIQSVRIAMGGVAATPLRLKKTEATLKGQAASQEVLDRAVNVLHSEMAPLSDLRGSSAFRRVIVQNLFERFFRSQS